MPVGKRIKRGLDRNASRDQTTIRQSSRIDGSAVDGMAPQEEIITLIEEEN